MNETFEALWKTNANQYINMLIAMRTTKSVHNKPEPYLSFIKAF